MIGVLHADRYARHCVDAIYPYTFIHTYIHRQVTTMMQRNVFRHGQLVKSPQGLAIWLITTDYHTITNHTLPRGDAGYGVGRLVGR